MSGRRWILFGAVSVLWGLPYALIKVAVDDGVPPTTLAVARTSIGALVLLALAWRAGVLGSVRGRLRWLAVYALVEIAAPFPLLAVGDTGNSSTYSEETWLEASAPLTYRSLRTENGVRIDIVTHNDGSSELYDAATNTIYAVPSGGLREVKQAQLPPAPPGAQLRPASPSEAPRPIGKPSLNPAPEQGTQSATDDPIRAKVLAILQSGDVSEAGHVTVDGRDAFRLVSADGTVTILVDPQTYEPILWQMSGGPNGAGLTAHFDVYERLADTQANATLFDLRAQHPDARVDASPDDYAAALARLSGTG